MKTLKIILLFTIISFFSSLASKAAARDCSNPKGFHEKLMCSMSGSSDKSTFKTKEIKKTKKSSILQKFVGWNKTNNSLSDIIKKNE